jgi:hypothetical protein
MPQRRLKFMLDRVKSLYPVQEPDLADRWNSSQKVKEEPYFRRTFSGPQTDRRRDM